MKIYLQITGTNNHISSFHINETEVHTVEHEIDDNFLEEFKQKMGNYYYLNNEITYLNIEQNKRRINELKLELLNTDYKVIKCYEANLIGEEMPYDLEALVAQRKAWREEINTLEFELSMLA